MAVELRGESLAPLPFLDWWSTNVFCRTSGAGEHDVPSQGRDPRCRFGQKTDTSIALPELASLKRGKNQSPKEFADSAKRLASRAYYSNDYMARKKPCSMRSRPAVREELHLKCAEQGCKMLEMAVETVEIQERYTWRAVWALRTEESEVTRHLKAMGEELIGEIRDHREQQKQSLHQIP